MFSSYSHGSDSQITAISSSRFYIGANELTEERQCSFLQVCVLLVFEKLLIIFLLLADFVAPLLSSAKYSLVSVQLHISMSKPVSLPMDTESRKAALAAD